jgi:hypothetical protein
MEDSAKKVGNRFLQRPKSSRSRTYCSQKEGKEKFRCANFHKNDIIRHLGLQDVRNTVGDGNALLANMYATGNGCEADMAQAKWHLSQAKEKGTSVPPGLEELVFGKGYGCARDTTHI